MSVRFDKKRVLVVEDEAAILVLIRDMLASIGTLDPITATSLAEGLKKLEENQVDIALLDINLAGESGLPIAECLKERGVPFLFVTGYGQPKVEPWRNWPTVEKPFPEARLKAAMEHVLQQ